MKRLIPFIAALLLLASPAMAKILVVDCRTTSTHANSNTAGLNNLWSHIVRQAGIKHSHMDVVPIAAKNSGGQYLVEVMDSTTTYQLIVFINTPDFNNSNRTAAQIEANGFGDFAKWIGPNDTSIDADILVLLPGHADSQTGSIWADSMGVIRHGFRNDTPEWGDKTYTWYVNEDGDSIFVSSHEGGTDSLSYIDPDKTGAGTITFPAKRTTCDADTVRAPVWVCEKSSGGKVWVVQTAAQSANYGLVLTILSMYEPSFTPIDIATVMTQFYVSSSGADTVGCSANLQDFISWHDTNSWKTTICINRYYCSARDWTDDWAARLAASSDIRLVLDGYYRYPFRDAAQTAAQTLTDCQNELNNLRGDTYWAGLIDTTTIWPLHGQYSGDTDSGAPGVAAIMEDVISQIGQTDLIVRGNAEYGGYRSGVAQPNSLKGLYFGVEDARRGYIPDGGDTESLIEMRTHPLGREIVTSSDSLSYNNIAYAMNMIAKGVTSAVMPTTFSVTNPDVHLLDTTGNLVASRGIYSGALFLKALTLKDISDDYLLTYKTTGSALDMPGYSAKIMVRFAKEYMDFHNAIAARYTQTGIVPFRNVWLRDVHYDRVLDRPYANSHVKEQ